MVVKSVLLGLQIALLSALTLGCFYAFQLTRNTSFYYLAFCWLAHVTYKIFTIGAYKTASDDSQVMLTAIVAIAADLPLFLSSFPAKWRKWWLPAFPIFSFGLIVYIYFNGPADNNLKIEYLYLVSATQPILILLWLACSTFFVKIFSASRIISTFLAFSFIGLIISQIAVAYFEVKHIKPDPLTQFSWATFSSVIFFSISVILFLIVRGELSGIKKEKAEAIEQLEVKGQFEYLGYLASSIEHEIRNPLDTFKDELDDLKIKLQNHPDLSSKFEKLEKSADRISIAADVINVLRMTKEEFRPKLKEWLVVERVNASLNYVKKEFSSWSEKIDPNVEEKTKELWIKADRYYLEEAFVNLFKNSYEAVTKENKSGKTKLDIELFANHEKVIVRFQDNGPGFISEDIPILTKPEYTKKDLSNSKANRGIGLFVCDKIVHLHDGEIVFSNSDDGGAVVTMTKVHPIV